MSSYTIVAGTTIPLQFQLLDNSAPINLLNITVTLLLSDRSGVTVSNPGTVAIVDTTDGKVSLTPTDANVFVSTKSPYQARWQLTDASGKVSYVPSASRDIWDITAK